jgi:hypothetical protein
VSGESATMRTPNFSNSGSRLSHRRNSATQYGHQ